MSALITMLVYLLLTVLVLGIVYAIGKALIAVLPFDPPIKNLAMTILYVIILLILLAVILGFTGVIPGWHLGRHW